MKIILFALLQWMFAKGTKPGQSKVEKLWESEKEDHFINLAERIGWVFHYGFERLNEDKSADIYLTLSGKAISSQKKKKIIDFIVNITQDDEMTLKSMKIEENFFDTFLHDATVKFNKKYYEASSKESFVRVTDEKILNLFKPLCIMLLRVNTENDIINKKDKDHRILLSLANILRLDYIITTLRLHFKRETNAYLKEQSTKHDNDEKNKIKKLIIISDKNANILDTLVNFAYTYYKNHVPTNVLLEKFDANIFVEEAKKKGQNISFPIQDKEKKDPNKKAFANINFETKDLGPIVDKFGEMNAKLLNHYETSKGWILRKSIRGSIIPNKLHYNGYEELYGKIFNGDYEKVTIQ